MTDEEMAEESLISYRKEPKWTGKMFMQDENTCYKDGFLAGLKASRPEWHKVADGDLPKENKSYLVYLDWLGRKSEILDKQEIKSLRKNVIAWCEIPKYMEE